MVIRAQHPPLLQPGDRVAIVAPGRKVDVNTVDDAIKIIIEGWNLSVTTGAHLFSKAHSYMSGSDDERRTDFQAMLDDPSIRCIICARGGYGSTRFVDDLNFERFSLHPKWVVGFSDVTALHLRLLQEGYASIHGTMPVLFSRKDSASSVQSLKDLLFLGDANLTAKGQAANREGEVTAPVVGGNLSLIVDSLGTNSEIKCDECILLIEEVDEYAYRLDRMINQLHRAKKLDRLAGLVIGHMTDIKEGDLPFREDIVAMISRVTAGQNYPIGYGFPSGHENPNMAWVQGGVATLSVKKAESSLVFRKSDI